MVTEILAVVTGIGVLGGLYFKLRQIRRDKYPKREAIFKCTREFLGRAWADEDADIPTLLQAFYHCKSEARFVFNKRFARYLDSLYEGVERYYDLELRLEIEGNRLAFEAKHHLQDQCFAQRHWLARQNMELEDRFAKYMRF